MTAATPAVESKASMRAIPVKGSHIVMAGGDHLNEKPSLLQREEPKSYSDEILVLYRVIYTIAVIGYGALMTVLWMRNSHEPSPSYPCHNVPEQWTTFSSRPPQTCTAPPISEIRVNWTTVIMALS
ncbi:hypothetical protein FRB96_005219 [Tulasnella sp. 330]|nr:hypothetical protein FRB96_005219 [Tulasnella sp. 330]KAG8890141.1 hypothetical protein FRB98_000869 [Tulasnella sp. 332]